MNMDNISCKAEQLTAITLSIFRLNGQLIDWGDQFGRPHELTSARWQVLGAIAMSEQAPSIPQIAITMGVTRQGVRKQIKRLIEDGLVRPLPNPTHKRSPLHALTASGQAAYQAVVERWHEHVRAMAAQFSAADLDATTRVFSTLSHVHDPRS